MKIVDRQIAYQTDDDDDVIPTLILTFSWSQHFFFSYASPQVESWVSLSWCIHWGTRKESDRDADYLAPILALIYLYNFVYTAAVYVIYQYN